MPVGSDSQQDSPDDMLNQDMDAEGETDRRTISINVKFHLINEYCKASMPASPSLRHAEDALHVEDLLPVEDALPIGDDQPQTSPDPDDDNSSLFQLDADTLQARADRTTTLQAIYASIDPHSERRFVDSRSGAPNTHAEYPPNAEEVYWENLGIWTYLPYSVGHSANNRIRICSNIF